MNIYVGNLSWTMTDEDLMNLFTEHGAVTSAKILKEAKDIKESIIAEAHQLAKDNAAKIVADAKLEIDSQKKVAIAEVKKEVSQLSIDIAQKVLGKELDSSKDHQSLINSLVDKVNLN